MNTPEVPEVDENRFLSKSEFKLIEKGLATQEEMSEIEGQFQVEEINQQENNNDVNSSSDYDGDNTEGCANPLKISVIINCVLQNLKFEDIKTACLVSKEWESCGRNILIPRSKINFPPSIPQKLGLIKSPDKFFKVFSKRNEYNKTFRFSQYVFSGEHSSKPWTIEQMNNFFRKQQQYITELELGELYLVNKYKERVHTFDVSPWISDLPLAKKNSETNTKLVIRNYFPQGVQFSVNSTVLSYVKDLELIECTVNLDGGIRISPVNLNIQFAKFFRDGNKLEQLCINTFVDFTLVKKMCLRNHPNWSVSTKFALDLNGRDKVGSLDLFEVRLFNWESSRWTIEELILRRVPLIMGKTRMQLKKLVFMHSQIDMSTLPATLEELVIADINEDTLWSTRPVVLPNLKSLKLDLTANCYSTFFQKVQCPNLIQLAVKGGKDNPEIDLAWLITSTSVKILHLDKIAIQNVENGEGRSLNLDKLVLNGYRFNELPEICIPQIKTKVMVLNFPIPETNVGGIVDFLTLLDNQKGPDLEQRIYISGQQRSVLPRERGQRPVYYHDGREYYVFENNLGKRIEEEEFVMNKQWP